MRIPKQQLELPFRPRGGKRAGAGRKRRPGSSNVRHRARPTVTTHTPLHVTVKLRRGLPRLRDQVVFVQVRALLARCRAAAFRIVEWTVQSDHVHLIVEGNDRAAISTGMAGFGVALAKLVNRIAARKGKVLRERYHAQPLTSPRQVRHALRYVLGNAHKHGVLARGIDPMSSGSMFDGWAELRPAPRARDSSVQRPRSWLLRVGWKRGGLLAIPGAPGGMQG